MELRDKDGFTEQEYLEHHKAQNYPKPALTADIAVFGKKGDTLSLLLIKRGGHPFLGSWALPGGFADPNEPSEVTAARELEEETTLSGLPLLPVGFYSAPGRDPRGWTVSMAYTSVIDLDKYTPKAADDAAEACWFRVSYDNEGFSLEHEGTLIKYAVSTDVSSDSCDSSDTSVSSNGASFNIPANAMQHLTFTPLTSDKLAFDHYQIVHDAIQTAVRTLSC